MSMTLQTSQRARGWSMRALAASLLFLATSLSSCGVVSTVQTDRDIYYLVDISKSYQVYSERSLERLRKTLGALRPGDKMTIGKIENCSYSDDSLLLPTHVLGGRITDANRDREWLGSQIDKIRGTLVPTPNTDIKGAFLMASQHFKRSRSGYKILVLFSDLRDDPQPGCSRDADKLIDLAGVVVVLADVSISAADQSDPQGRANRLKYWRSFATEHGAAGVEEVTGVYEVQSVIDSLGN